MRTGEVVRGRIRTASTLELQAKRNLCNLILLVWAQLSRDEGRTGPLVGLALGERAVFEAACEQSKRGGDGWRGRAQTYRRHRHRSKP